MGVGDSDDYDSEEDSALAFVNVLMMHDPNFI